MPYHPNIPQPNNDPKFSQQDLLDNFQALNTQFGVNHVPFVSGNNNGFHTLIKFFGTLGSDPGVVGNQSCVYTKLVSSIPQLFFQNSASVKQLTNLPTTLLDGVTGFVTPWGFTINVGKSLAIGDVDYAITYSDKAYTILLTPNVNGSSTTFYSASNNTATKFTINSAISGFTFNFFSIGPT